VNALVIGEALVDVVDVPGSALRRTPGGSPFNVAIGLARLQIPTALLTSIGADTDGDSLLTDVWGHVTAWSGESRYGISTNGDRPPIGR